MKLDKQELLKLLRTQGDNDTADKAERELPDEVDTDRDGDALDALGLDRTQLTAKLAGGDSGRRSPLTLTPGSARGRRCRRPGPGTPGSPRRRRPPPRRTPASRT